MTRRRRSRSRSRGWWEESHSSKHHKESQSFFSQPAKSCSEPHVLRSRRAHLIRISMIRFHQNRERCCQYKKRCRLCQSHPVRSTLLFRVCTEVTLTYHIRVIVTLFYSVIHTILIILIILSRPEYKMIFFLEITFEKVQHILSHRYTKIF